MNGWGTEYYVGAECGRVWKVLTNGTGESLDRCSTCGTFNTTKHEQEPESGPDPGEIRSDTTVEDILDELE